jgi:mannose-6-phosphate isomerase-like protein (cupin superfamily)
MGECIVLLLTGAMTVVVERHDGTEDRLELLPGQSCLVPRGLWHRQIVREPSERVFITAGAGTEFRPVDQGDIGHP